MQSFCYVEIHEQTMYMYMYCSKLIIVWNSDPLRTSSSIAAVLWLCIVHRISLQPLWSDFSATLTAYVPWHFIRLIRFSSPDPRITRWNCGTFRKQCKPKSRSTTSLRLLLLLLCICHIKIYTYLHAFCVILVLVRGRTERRHWTWSRCTRSARTTAQSSAWRWTAPATRATAAAPTPPSAAGTCPAPTSTPTTRSVSARVLAKAITKCTCTIEVCC